MRHSVVALAVLLGGCFPSGTREADRYFILETGKAKQAAVAVRIEPTSAASFYDTQSIVYSRTPGTRAYYQFNHWTERPQQAIYEELARRLRPGFKGLVLQTNLREIYHDAAKPPGTARIALEAELVNPTTRAVIARRTFEQSAPAASYDAPGAVQGFRQALDALLDELVAWIQAESAR